MDEEMNKWYNKWVSHWMKHKWPWINYELKIICKRREASIKLRVNSQSCICDSILLLLFSIDRWDSLQKDKFCKSYEFCISHFSQSWQCLLLRYHHGRRSVAAVWFDWKYWNICLRTFRQIFSYYSYLQYVQLNFE